MVNVALDNQHFPRPEGHFTSRHAHEPHPTWWIGAQSAQRGHMQLCQGVVAAWRNPRAHENLSDDPARVLVMLATVQELMAITRQATRTRKRRTR
ncbi:TIGR02391 family protein [Microbacterium sp. MMO-20]|uniref:TIGR02391 family protein n=1 Tax=unclassified Microbacterium TaxID=2609290 RepID=UPI003FA5FC88